MLSRISIRLISIPFCQAGIKAMFLTVLRERPAKLSGIVPQNIFHSRVHEQNCSSFIDNIHAEGNCLKQHFVKRMSVPKRFFIFQHFQCEGNILYKFIIKFSLFLTEVVDFICVEINCPDNLRRGLKRKNRHGLQSQSKRFFLPGKHSLIMFNIAAINISGIWYLLFPSVLFLPGRPKVQFASV